ncbi:hypothetical protein LOK49_LG02G04023 [Camellia lanceoleosa]|uniref:Uncharacterized protein n=1 Tax=Camellia lanceoleosa TaxID=1840588 RepID=A0ACC0IRT0_9ERIC|nr:hypothetical protein LOK49_LG02G04023 [Camellia lanceoleosa]
MRSWTLGYDPCPHSIPPFMMFVMTLNPGTPSAERSAAVGVHLSEITSWHEGFGDCGVIQNHNAVLNETTGSDAKGYSRDSPQ